MNAHLAIIFLMPILHCSAQGFPIHDSRNNHCLPCSDNPGQEQRLQHDIDPIDTLSDEQVALTVHHTYQQVAPTLYLPDTLSQIITSYVIDYERKDIFEERRVQLAHEAHQLEVDNKYRRLCLAVLIEVYGWLMTFLSIALCFDTDIEKGTIIALGTIGGFCSLTGICFLYKIHRDSRDIPESEEVLLH